jgi:hypothetical protein
VEEDTASHLFKDTAVVFSFAAASLLWIQISFKGKRKGGFDYGIG